MKASVPILADSPAMEKPGIGIYLELTKARLTSLVLLTTMVGFYMGIRDGAGGAVYLLLLNTLIGTGLVASGAAALNQLLEKDHDALMPRTEGRPLPSGRLHPDVVLIFGGLCAAGGLVYLAFAVNLLTSFLGALTLATYLFIYTPLKRVTTLNTVIGAVPGALPPLMGWAAARGEVTIEGWSLFAILFFWQLPHFYAIAWIYREEYAKAGFVMLPVVDTEGLRIGRQAVSHSLGLLPLSLFPFLFHLSGVVYLTGALALSLVFLWLAIQFSRDLSKHRARRLFYGSIIYLPLLLGLMVFDKLK